MDVHSNSITQTATVLLAVKQPHTRTQHARRDEEDSELEEEEMCVALIWSGFGISTCASCGAGCFSAIIFLELDSKCQ